MPNDRVAVVGDKNAISAFKALGADVYGVKEFSEAEGVIKKLARDYSVIFVTEDIAKAHSELINRYKARPYPAVIPIPTAAGSDGYGMAAINENVEKAIGSSITLDEE